MLKITLEAILLHLGLALSFNMLCALRRCRTSTFPLDLAQFNLYLPPPMRGILKRVRRDFVRLFPPPRPSKRPVGRPRFYRLPFFRVWVWNRLFLHKSPAAMLKLLATNSTLRQFFELPATGLKKTTYETFVKEELAGYLAPLIARNVGELLAKHLVKGLILAGDDFPLESPLNLSKSIDFPLPEEPTVRRVFKALGDFTWVDVSVGVRPNRQRGWADYLKLYLFYLLWGFPSQTKFNKFLRTHSALAEWLQLERRPVQAKTFFEYIRQLEALEGAEELFHQIFQHLIRRARIRKRLPARGRPRELGELYGIMGNVHGAKDPGAALHYNASKGRYFYGRIGRILVDTWSQIPIWATITAVGQPLAWELQTFGQKVTALLGDKVKPLLVLFDSGFQGKARLRALRQGFHTAWQIMITRPYNRAKSMMDIFRRERLAVERGIGHLTVQLGLETPPHRGTQAAEAWVLGTVYLQQLGALWNADQEPTRPLTGLVHFRA